MKRYALIIGLMLVAGTAAAQTNEELYSDGLLQLAQTHVVPGPFNINVRTTNSDSTAKLQTGLQGTWWRESRWVRDLTLTEEQQKKMDDVFRQNRIKLIDLSATLEKAELLLEPLVQNVKPGDEAKILAQIDEIANARAELEKTNARMLLGIREVLTQEQWDKLPKNRTSFNFTTIQPRTPAPSAPPAAPVPPAAPTPFGDKK